MATPPRLVELECPICHASHWVIDSDYGGADMITGGVELPYEERTYACSNCHEEAAGHHVLRKGPPEFFLQPHPMYPMTRDDFDYWVDILRAHFPDHPMLEKVHGEWRPGADASS